MNLNPRVLWASVYAISNIAAFVIILEQGVLIGDLDGFAAPSAVDLAVTLLMVCGSIFGLLGIHAFLCRVRLSSSRQSIVGSRMAPYMTVLLLIFIVYVAHTGLFIAGSTERGGSVVSALWVVLNVDALFFVYYATCREDRGFKFNLLLWVISFLQRGWFAYLFFVIGMESFRIIREKRLFRWRSFIVLLPFIAVYPFLDLVKVYVRVSESITLSDAVGIVENGLSMADFSWINSFQLAGEKIIGRVQLISHAEVVRDNISYFSALSEVALNPFWKEGVLGIVFARIFGEPPGAEAGQALASFIAPSLDSSWNVNPSLIGWLSMHLDALPFAIIYLICLCVVSVWLHQQLTRSEASFDRLWFIWLSMLIPGWIAQFVSILLAQAIFVLVARSVGATARIEKALHGSGITSHKTKGAK